jgi:tetratricopeptide (TPR) repeat protein
MGHTFLQCGRPLDAAKHLEQAANFYEPVQDRTSALQYGTDSKANALGALSRSLCLLGYPDRAFVAARQAATHAETLGHFHTVAYALVWLSRVHLFRGAPEMAVEQAKRVMDLSEKHGFRQYYEMAKGNCGAALIELGETGEGMALVQQSLDASDMAGVRYNRTVQFAVLGEGATAARKWEDAATYLDRAVTEVQATEERWYEAEIHRFKGELVLARNGVAEATQAQSCFNDSLEVARQQQAKCWELRTIISLARLWQRQAKLKEAYNLLTPIYNWFTEGFDTRDLREAKALLEELS